MPASKYSGPLPMIGDRIVVQNVEREVRKRIFSPFEGPAPRPDGVTVTLVVDPARNDLDLQEI